MADRIDYSAVARYSVDTSGHEHAPAGNPQGGQFVADDIDRAAVAKPEAATGGMTPDVAAGKIQGLLDNINKGTVGTEHIEALGNEMKSMSKEQLAELFPKVKIMGKPKSKSDAISKIKQVLVNQLGMYRYTHPNG
jgi:hypothetical protein